MAAIRKPRIFRRIAIIILILIVGLVGSALSLTPSPAPTPPPTAAEAFAARRAFERLRHSNDEKGFRELRVSWAELASIAKLGGRALEIDNSHLERDKDRVKLSGSMKLRFGLFANAIIWVHASQNAAPILDGKMGSLPLPPLVMNGLISVARFMLRQKGVNVPEPKHVIKSLTVGDQDLVAQLDLSNDAGLLQAFNSLNHVPIDLPTVARLYCDLVKAQANQPTTDFPFLVRRSSQLIQSDPKEARALMVSIAMLTVSPKAGEMAGHILPLIKTCKRQPLGLLLLEREDLPKHWALSAALAATYGTNVSDAMGAWKEVSDSAPSGSGFSYVDLASDRSGSLIGTKLSDRESVAQTLHWLSGASEDKLLPIKNLALAEGMTEEQYKRSYVSIESKEHQSIVAKIDRALALEFSR